MVSSHGLHEIRSYCLISMDLHIFLPRFWKSLLHGTLEKESQRVPGILLPAVDSDPTRPALERRRVIFAFGAR